MLTLERNREIVSFLTSYWKHVCVVRWVDAGKQSYEQMTINSNA